ncbi:MAG: methyltransferase domain-containing protein, partial [Desulfovibrionaceae bacterium]|nr:methyltransferase domain-containing protein [Desulfovibrionaceae bacterium]
GNWYQKCARGFERNECMWEILPQKVFGQVRKFFSEQEEYVYSLSEPALYSSSGLAALEPLLDDILSVCSLPKKPLSEHIAGAGGTYIHASKQWEYPYAVAAVNAMGRNRLKIADVGGGRGALSWYLAAKGHDVTVYDINYLWDDEGDPDIENRFIRFAEAKGFRADFGSVFNIPAEDNSFDAVTCISVVEHIPFKEFALKEMLRVLKPGGRLILTYDLVLDNPAGRDPLRVEIFTPRSICEALAKVGIATDAVYPEEEALESLQAISADRVNIAPDMTVGGLVINKMQA